MPGHVITIPRRGRCYALDCDLPRKERMALSKPRCPRGGSADATGRPWHRVHASMWLGCVQCSSTLRKITLLSLCKRAIAESVQGEGNCRPCRNKWKEYLLSSRCRSIRPPPKAQAVAANPELLVKMRAALVALCPLRVLLVAVAGISLLKQRGAVHANFTCYSIVIRCKTQYDCLSNRHFCEKESGNCCYLTSDGF